MRSFFCGHGCAHFLLFGENYEEQNPLFGPGGYDRSVVCGTYPFAEYSDSQFRIFCYSVPGVGGAVHTGSVHPGGDPGTYRWLRAVQSDLCRGAAFGCTGGWLGNVIGGFRNVRPAERFIQTGTFRQPITASSMVSVQAAESASPKWTCS